MSRRERIEQQLIAEFSPVFLTVEDESSNHHVPENAQTHYKIVMAAEHFTSLSRVNRHKALNTLLKKEFEEGIHALSMHLYSPEEWQLQNTSVLKSPSCRDGYKNK